MNTIVGGKSAWGNLGYTSRRLPLGTVTWVSNHIGYSLWSPIVFARRAGNALLPLGFALSIFCFGFSSAAQLKDILWGLIPQIFRENLEKKPLISLPRSRDSCLCFYPSKLSPKYASSSSILSQFSTFIMMYCVKFSALISVFITSWHLQWLCWVPHEQHTLEGA